MRQVFSPARDGLETADSGDPTMLAATRRVVALYVDRSTQQWVVRDPEGDFWLLPSSDNSWERREPFVVSDETELEIIPGHYRYMLNLPF
jgi:hypothetical protein